MLPRTNRLTLDRDFANLYKKGRAVKTGSLSLIYNKNNQNASRFGFVVSKKHAAKIVHRNRIKRVLRAAVAAVAKKISPGFDVIIQGKPAIKNLKAQQIRNELLELLTRSKLLQ